ncbi:30S ribosomal protein S7 [Bacillus sp. JEM-1]|uniref:30S ribosomal protein S7 n=1 Tax=Bacillus sp. JEM-1 TaxID=1977090 RepID=UPI000B48D67D|nr:30S ribosomal protein S7 [Bacillus sp. JEM-1]
MPRKGTVANRDVLPVPMYNSMIVTRLINKMMVVCKKGKSQTILFNAYVMVSERTGKEPMEVFELALKSLIPVIEVLARRVGCANYQVPVGARPELRTTLGLRWLVINARLRGDKSIEELFASKILDADNNAYASAEKREVTHKIA